MDQLALHDENGNIIDRAANKAAWSGLLREREEDVVAAAYRHADMQNAVGTVGTHSTIEIDPGQTFRKAMIAKAAATRTRLLLAARAYAAVLDEANAAAQDGFSTAPKED